MDIDHHIDHYSLHIKVFLYIALKKATSFHEHLFHGIVYIHII